MLNRLQEISGIQGVTPSIDPTDGLQELSFRIDKLMDLSVILEVLLNYDLNIKTMNTMEPTLEDAFIAITGERPAVPRRRVRR